MNKCTRCGKENPPEVHTCSPQSAALRLADTLERMVLSTKWDKEAATELRRLDALNAELVEVLKEMVSYANKYDFCGSTNRLRERTRAALKKAKEQT